MKAQSSTLRTVFYKQGCIFGLKMNETSLKVIFQVSLPLENRRILDQKYTDIRTIRTNL
jgi:hypothetical protein